MFAPMMHENVKYRPVDKENEQEDQRLINNLFKKYPDLKYEIMTVT